MDTNRIKANICIIDINLNVLSEIIDDAKKNFIFNIDEMWIRQQRLCMQQVAITRATLDDD